MNFCDPEAKSDLLVKESELELFFKQADQHSAIFSFTELASSILFD